MPPISLRMLYKLPRKIDVLADVFAQTYSVTFDQRAAILHFPATDRGPHGAPKLVAPPGIDIPEVALRRVIDKGDQLPWGWVEQSQGGSLEGTVEVIAIGIHRRR